MYVSVAEVRNTIGINDTAIIPDTTIEQAISFAEDEIDRFTNTTYYPVEEKGVVTTSTNTELTDSNKSWIPDLYANYAVYIYSGTGKGQIREITTNTIDTLTIDRAWDTNPDTTSKYYITYNNKITELLDGKAEIELQVDKYPIIQVDSLKINDVAISSSNYYIYNKTGKISLKNTAEKKYFGTGSTEDDRQAINLTYWYGILAENRKGKIDLPQQIKRLCAIVAGLKALSYQMGGTYNTLSTFTLPEFSGTIGQAYVNIKGTVDVLNNELTELKKMIVGRNPYME